MVYPLLRSDTEGAVQDTTMVWVNSESADPAARGLLQLSSPTFSANRALDVGATPAAFLVSAVPNSFFLLLGLRRTQLLFFLVSAVPNSFFLVSAVPNSVDGLMEIAS